VHSEPFGRTYPLLGCEVNVCLYVMTAVDVNLQRFVDRCSQGVCLGGLKRHCSLPQRGSGQKIKTIGAILDSWVQLLPPLLPQLRLRVNEKLIAVYVMSAVNQSINIGLGLL